jgi:hypothetical protein
MTVSANYSWTGVVDDICRRGMQLAGLLPLGRTVDADTQAHLRELLQDTLKSLRALGVGLDQWENTTVAIAAGTSGTVTTTSLPDDTVTLDFPIMIIGASETSQTAVQRYVWEQYQQITDKTTIGRPIAAYLETGATLGIKWWPVPDQAYTASYRRERLARDADSGTTVDLRPVWTDALVYTMAHKCALAGSLGAERCRMISELAEAAVARCRGYEHEGGDVQFVLEMF